MWNVVKIKSEQYILKISYVEGIYEFFLSNLKCIWKNKLSENKIADIIHELNPQIEASTKVLVTKAVAMVCEVTEGEDTKEIDFAEEDNGIIIKSQSKIGGFPFKFNLKLDLLPSENFYPELTLPLVLMLQVLKDREEKLLEIVRLKDDEIEDYRLGGAQLSHEMLKTKRFDEKEHVEGSVESKKLQEVMQSPAKYFSSLFGLYEETTKEITRSKITGQMSNENAAADFPQQSPDLFEESCEPQPKIKAVSKEMPTLLKVELKPKKQRFAKSSTQRKKLQI